MSDGEIVLIVLTIIFGGHFLMSGNITKSRVGVICGAFCAC